MAYIGNSPALDETVSSSQIVDLTVATADIAADAITGAKIADDAIDSEHYTDGSIDTAHIADNQITLAKMAGGTDGNIISYDASGDPVAIATGTDGQVLTSTGAGSPPAFEAVTAAPVTALNNATESELVTVGSTTTELDAEANLTFDGTDLLIGSTGKLYLYDAGGEWIYANGSDMFLSSGGSFNFYASAAGHRLVWDGAEFFPVQDDEELLGHSSYHWNELYCENATINTSDEREKENIEDSSLGLSFLNQLRAVQYKRKDRTVPEVLYEEVDDIPEGKEIGDVKTEAREKTYVRTHYGLIAQEVEQVLENNNIDSIDFAPFIKSPVLDGDGINGEPTGEHRYGMRYAEYVGILIKAVQELSAKVEALENA